MKENQGFVVSLLLTDDRLSLRLFRLIPIASIRLEDIAAFHLGRPADLIPHRTTHLFRIFRSQYWPTRVRKKQRLTCVNVLIQGVHRRRILVKMTAGFHYSFRLAVSRKTQLAQEKMTEDVSDPSRVRA